MRAGLKYVIHETSGVGEARRGSVDLARSLGFNEVRQGEVAIIVTELASNLVKHARGGELLVRPSDGPDPLHLEILALDRGPGIARPNEVMRDGYSTAGTPGTGLGAAQRLSSQFDLYSQPGVGTAVLASVHAPGASRVEERFDFGLVNVPHPHETVSGDGWGVSLHGARFTGMLVDGLGHGLGAHDAARAAAISFHRNPGDSPSELLDALHGAMRGTRGGVAGVAMIDAGTQQVTFSGMGNINAAIITGDSRRGFVSQNGTMGLTMPRRQEFTLPWTRDSLMVMHTDGLSNMWDLSRYPGLARRAAPLIAGVLYRDGSRGRDDVTVLVVKEVRP